MDKYLAMYLGMLIEITVFLNFFLIIRHKFLFYTNTLISIDLAQYMKFYD